jgi:hypothetical protein
VRPRRQRGAAMHLAADAASDTAHNGGDRMCRRSDCLLVVFGTCYFAPNICSSLPSWLDRQRATPFLKERDTTAPMGLVRREAKVTSFSRCNACAGLAIPRQSGNSNQVVAQHQDGSLSRCTLRTVSSCNRMRRMRSGITTASLHRLQQRPRLTGSAL